MSYERKALPFAAILALASLAACGEGTDVEEPEMTTGEVLVTDQQGRPALPASRAETEADEVPAEQAAGQASSDNPDLFAAGDLQPGGAGEGANAKAKP